MQDYEKNQASLQSAEEQLKKMELSSRKLTSEHETAISLIKSENLELMKELQRSLSVLEAAKSEAETATSEIAIREKKNSQLYSEIATLKDNLSQLTSQCEEAKLHSLEFKNFNETLRIKVKEFENLKNTLENDLSALKNENSSLTLELCVSKEQVETLNTQLDDSRMKCKDLENRVFHLMNDNKSLDSSYNKQISELETQRLLLESQISNFKLDNSQLHLQIHELREQKGTINEEYYSIKQKYQTLNIEHTFTLKSLTEAKNMLESLTIKQKELEEILDLNQQQLSSKQASLSRVETKYELQEKELNAIRQEKSQLELKFCATEKKVEDLQSKLQELTASDSSTKSTLQNVFSKLSSKTAELECAQTELLKLKKDLADALSNLKELESHKSEQTTTSAFYEKEISDMKSRMELEMEEHKHLVTKLQASLTTHIAIGKHLNSEKDQLDSQISLLRSKFSQLEENYDNILDQYQNQTRSHHALEQKYMSLEEQCHFIRARNSGLESKHIEHLKLLETMEQTFKKRSLNEKDEQETKLNEISKELDNLVAEKKKDETLSKEKIESLEKVKRELQEKLQRNETTLSELQSQLNNKAIQLHRFHVQSEEEKKQLELELERQTDKNKSLNQAVTSLTKKLEHFQKFSKTQSVEPLEEYETSHNADPELVRKYERLQVRYSNLEAELLELKDLTLQLDENILSKRCRALEEELSALCVEHESLLKQNRQLNAKLDAQHDLLVQNSELSMQIAMLNELNTSLMGHQNQNQKIRYLVRLKEECSRLKEQLSSTMKERDQNRFRITELEAELSALRPVEHTSGKKRPRIDFLGSLTPNKK
ncbi:hypothetical protein HMI56_003103 [Coelomomyces lativittatus]|nr:hypothetical protein HMI56_003103 [Coelomomyces lativittatus]